MDTIDSSLRRIDATIGTIRNLKDSEFPYHDSNEALLEVERIFEETRQALCQAKDSTDQSIKKQISEEALKRLFIYIPLLGFILRSTNVRNAFEIHGPLLRLSQRFLGDDTRLLLSSEWDYSPMTYPGVPQMKKFILIGFPATESSNPFLIPLAGHELGHNLWLNRGMTSPANVAVTQIIQDEIWNSRLDKFKELYKTNELEKSRFWGDLFNKEIIGPATVWATLQAEETFCDLIGLRIFGSSFLHAFVYLLSPGQRSRHVAYPSSHTRVTNLLGAARDWNVTAPLEYASAFQQVDGDRFVEKDTFQLELAEFAVATLVPHLKLAADKLVTAAGIELPDPQSVQEMRERINLTVPAETAKSLAVIIEAGWDAILDNELWKNYSHLDANSKHENLTEIILKSIEALEIQARIKG